MFSDLFSSLRRHFHRDDVAERTKTVEPAAAETQLWSPEKICMPSRADRVKIMIEKARLENLTRWEPKDLNSALRMGALYSLPLAHWPEQIDVSGLAPTLRGLRQLTLKDGNERGKFGFINTFSGQLILGPHSVGDTTSVGIRLWSPADWNCEKLLPCIDLHTHPSTRRWLRSDHYASEHLSAADFANLLSASFLQASIVIGERRILAVFKSEHTPQRKDSDTFKAEVMKRFDELLIRHAMAHGGES